ncbi:MAG: protease complex subunit PrcB family protein [Proteobacteria bacterium]|nr:protease complex subunit PrcB family protein [Pseudomonadota bacterium]MBU1686333.1 protease complex subunit PrcB family protein [Pseudomonadota bacterium]
MATLHPSAPLIFLLLLLQAGCSPVLQEPLPVTRLWAGQFCRISNEPEARWIRDQKSLANIFERLSPPSISPTSSKPPINDPIDFTKELLLLISMGEQPTAGFSLTSAPTAPILTNGTAQLNFTWHRPDPTRMTAQVITNPCLLVKLPNHGYRNLEIIDQDGKTQFQLPLDH